MDKIVLDTNVLLSGLKSKRGSSNHLLREVINEKFLVNFSVPLVLEYEKVLSDPKSKCPMSLSQIRDFLDYFCKVGVCYKIHYLWRPFLVDSKDDMVLELAVASQTKYILTYNLRDFRGVEQFNIKALSPYDFLKKKGMI